MKQEKNDQSRKKNLDMLGLELGSMENLKTHEDFNNQHPKELDELALKQGNSEGDNNNSTKKLKPKKK